MRREYESGMKWCVWRWKSIYWQGDEYLLRLHVFQCPLFAIMVHWVNGKDDQMHLHDHPVSMLSILLKGFYCELRDFNTRPVNRNVRLYNWIPAKTKHRIWFVPPGGCTTLVICGPRERDWGFHTENGWIPWREYHDLYGGETS